MRPLEIPVKYELAADFRHRVQSHKGCKIINVFEIVSNFVLQFWVECPPELEQQMTDYGFYTWVYNPKFQKYYAETDAFKLLTERRNHVST